MPEFFSSDGSLPLQFVVIFGVIVVLMMAAYLLFRRIAGRGLSLSARAGSRSRQPRLGIVDIYELDRQRQLILLRRDNVEHLLLVGGPNDVVVERNVQRGAGSRLPAETAMRPETAPDMPELGPPSPDFSAKAFSTQAFPAPAFEMPVVVAPPLPGSTQTPEPQAPRLDPALFEPDAEPERSEAGAADLSGTAAGRERSSRFLRRTPPPLATAPRAEPASQRPQAPAEPPPFAEPAPPVIAAREPRTVDPAVLSDMARQLETALLRPSSAVTPPPVQRPAPAAEPARPAPPPEPPAPVSAPPEPEPAPQPEPAPDPIAARMAAAQAPADPQPTEPEPKPTEAAAPLPAPRPVQPRTPEPPARPAQAMPAPPPSAIPVPSPAPVERQPDPAKGANPFSVEEIEAEFARLLGRPLDKKG